MEENQGSPRFSRVKRDRLDNPNQTEVVFREDGSDFVIHANAGGVFFTGNSRLFTGPVEMNELAQAIGRAGQDFVELKRALRSKLTQ